VGILDDLKQEADRLREQQDTEEQRRQRKEALYRERFRPVLLRVFRYLNEMVEQLKVVNLVTNATYDLPGFGVVSELQHTGYRVLIDSKTNPQKVFLQFDCISPKERRYIVTPMKKADEAREFIINHRVPLVEWPVRDKDNKIVGAAFQAKLQVRVRILVEADVENARIIVSSADFEGVGVKRVSFGVATIDDAWLDDLGHYILRKKETIGRVDLPEEALRRLRAQVAEEEASRHEELAVPGKAPLPKAEPEVTAEAPPEDFTETRLVHNVRKVLLTPIQIAPKGGGKVSEEDLPLAERARLEEAEARRAAAGEPEREVEEGGFLKGLRKVLFTPIPFPGADKDDDQK
jgi:hypothetical protein